MSSGKGRASDPIRSCVERTDGLQGVQLLWTPKLILRFCTLAHNSIDDTSEHLPLREFPVISISY